MARKSIAEKEKEPMPVEVRVYELLQQRFGENEDDWPSQVEIADQVGIRPSTAAAWIKRRLDRIELNTLDKWCEYFGVEVGDVLVRIPPQERKR